MLRKLLKALALLLAAGAVGLFLVTRLPVLNFLGRHAGPALGYSFQVEGLDLSWGGATLRGLTLASASLRGSVARASLAADPLRLSLDEVTVEGARLRYVYDPAAPAFDYRRAVEGLPSLARLTVRDTSADIIAKDGSWALRLDSVSAGAQDFSPRRGGRLSWRARVSYTTRDHSSQAAGTLSGSADLATLLPHPAGRATLAARLSGRLAGRQVDGLEVSLPVEVSGAGVVRLAGAGLAARQMKLSPKVSLAAARMTLPATLDLARRTFSVAGARAEIFFAEGPPGSLGGSGKVRKGGHLPAAVGVRRPLAIGAVQGLGRLTLSASGGWQARAPLTLNWHAKLSADSLEVARLRELAAPLAPALAGWQAAGRASLTADVAGVFRPAAPRALAWSGEARLKLARGSFSSPDYSKAGEGIAASLTVRLKGPPPPAPGWFEAEAELGAGQLLAGGVLADAAELRPHVLAEGGFFLPAASRILPAPRPA